MAASASAALLLASVSTSGLSCWKIVSRSSATTFLRLANHWRRRRESSFSASALSRQRKRVLQRYAKPRRLRSYRIPGQVEVGKHRTDTTRRCWSPSMGARPPTSAELVSSAPMWKGPSGHPDRYTRVEKGGELAER